MNEFQEVSMEEMSQVVGGSFWGKVWNVVEKVAVAVLTAVAVKQVGKI